MSRREPIFNAPGAVIGLILLMAAVAGGMALLGEEDEIRALLTLAFIPARFSILGSELPGAPWATWTSFVTHIFVHGGVVHLVINCAWLLAFGGAVATRIGSARFLILTVLTGIAGAALFLAFNWGRAVPMVGASGAVSGLMGCAFRFFFSGLNRQSLGYPPEHPADLPRMDLLELFTDRRAATAIGVWVGLNALAGLIGPAITGGAGIAWEAHLGGFIAGLLLFGLFDTGNALPEPPNPRLRPNAEHEQ